MEVKMSNAKILVTDDSPTDLKVICQPLISKGYDVITAEDGEEALEKAEANQPALMILDVIMPKMNGFQVCRKVKTTPGLEGIKVILLTGKNQESDEFWGMKQGADAYMTKPFDEDALLKNVSNLL
jgi:twitching motility two-component system response regulator PilH